MSNKNSVTSNIKKYGAKGACYLVSVDSTSNQQEMTVNNTESEPVPLLSMVTRFPDNRIDGKMIYASDRRILATTDSDWGGTIKPSDKINIGNTEYSIVSFNPLYEGLELLFVEIQVRG